MNKRQQEAYIEQMIADELFNDEMDEWVNDAIKNNGGVK